MSQVTVYLDEETRARLEQSAEADGLFKSHGLAELIRVKTAEEWPKWMAEMAGEWTDLPTTDELRREDGRDAPREPL